MDIFCQIKEKLKDQVIEETKNFYAVHDGYPLTEGHLLIVPKEHVDCYLNLNKKLKKEFLCLKNKLVMFLENYYQYPVIFEHGIAGQTVLHAHLHLLPTNIVILDKLKQLGQLTRTPKIPYLYFEYKNKKYYFDPIKKIKPGLLHSIIYAKLLNRSVVSLERARDLNNWLLKVKNKYSLWQRLNNQ